MTAHLEDVVAELRRIRAERDEAIAQQAATAEVLRVINDSPGDLAPVFDAIVEKAMRLCGAAFGGLYVVDGDLVRAVSGRNLPGPFLEFLTREPMPLTLVFGRAARDRPFLHIADLSATEAYRNRVPLTVAAVELGGIRTFLGAPLREGGAVVGIINLYRQEVRPFSDQQIAIAQSFAAQAQIAMKNARLMNETRQSLERQTATSEILRVISRSPTDATPVFESIVRTAVRLLRCDVAAAFVCDAATYSPVAAADSQGLLADLGPTNTPIDPDANFPSRAILAKQMLHVPDWSRIELPEHERRVHVATGVKSALYLPLLHEGACIGLIALIGMRPDIFGPGEIAQAESFRDQALIAIQNARLFNETREALERQTATAEILRVISQSPTETRPVFESIVLTAVRALRCDLAFVLLRDGSTYGPVAVASPEGPLADVGPTNLPIDPNHNFPSRAILDKKKLHLPDWSLIDLPEHERNIHATFGVNSALYLPLMREDECIGLLTLVGKRPNSFGPGEIAQAESFRDQALIAIENSRLFNETKEALERQTATAEILKVIAGSPSDVQPVFEAIATNSNRLIGGFSTAVLRFVGDALHLAAFTPTNAAADEVLKASFPRPLAEFPPFVLVRDGNTEQFVDTEAELGVPPLIRELARLRGYRSMLFTPLMSDGAPIGMISVTRKEPGAFAAHHVRLLQTFADQAVIAIQNVRAVQRDAGGAGAAEGLGRRAQRDRQVRFGRRAGVRGNPRRLPATVRLG